MRIRLTVIATREWTVDPDDFRSREGTLPETQGILQDIKDAAEDDPFLFLDYEDTEWKVLTEQV